MEGEFNYSGKTAIESLQELCILRKYPQPLFLDRSQSNKIQVTAVVGGKIYGSAEGKTLVEACEHAATTTLSIWLKDKFDPQLLRKPSPPPNEDAPKVKTAPTAATPPTMTNSSISESQLNAVSLLHVFASSILYDPASKPEYDVSRVDDKFVCNLTVVHKFKTYKTGGEGKTKVLAKRVAALAMLQNFYPHLHTVEQMSEAVTADIESKKGDKKTSKISKVPPREEDRKPQLQSNPETKDDQMEQYQEEIEIPPLQDGIPDTKDDLTEIVVSVVSNLEKYNISPPTNYSFRLATALDADSILGLIKELATYEQSPDSVLMTREILLRDGWGINRKYSTSVFRPDFYVYLVDHHSNGSKKTVGMALFFQAYSTWKGRSIHLEDLYVQEQHRAYGLGTLLMRAVAAVVDEMKMTRIEWVCLTWNEKPRQFYSTLGTTELSDWVSIRMEDESIHNFVHRGRPSSSRVDAEAETPICGVESRVSEEEQQINRVHSAVSWNDRFALARKVGNECDKDVENFHTQTPSERGGGGQRTGVGDVEEGEEIEQQESGGFCQPASLATFVANELKIREEVQDNQVTSSRMKRPLTDCCSVSVSAEERSQRGDVKEETCQAQSWLREEEGLVEVKRSKSDPSVAV